jgi:hypothetical protein
MATEEQPEKQPDGKQWSPPRGIRYSDRKGVPRPFLLHWRGPDGVRKCVAYEDRKTREKAAKALIAKRELNGRAVLNFKPSEWAVWEQFKTMIGTADPIEVARFWISKGGRTTGESVTVAELVKRYMATRIKEGTGKASLSHAKKDLERLCEKFGAEPANAVSADALRDWIAALPFTPTTKGNHHKHGSTVFNWGTREGLIEKNPFQNIERPPLTSEEVSILTVEDTRKLFAAAKIHRPHACARLALEAFAGLRNGTAGAIAKPEIDFAARGLRIPAAKIKTARPQYIEGLPENLWTWLNAATDESWTLSAKDYERAKSDVFRLSGVVNPGNVLRHSFCSYHVAQHKDAARTAVILCHSSPRMLYQHYKGIATEADAKEYFSITPASNKLLESNLQMPMK